jgi:TRAP-type C4-dicarboxylate transport system permease small subunit
LDLFVRAVAAVSRFCGYIAAGLIALGVLVVCHMVFVRYVLNHNTIWQTDFVTYSLVAATFIGSPFVLMTRGHVNVDVLPLYAGPRFRFWLAVFASALTVLFVVGMTVLTYFFWRESWDNKWVSDTMWRARLWIPYACMPLGLGILSLQAIADFACLVTGRQLPFGLAAKGIAAHVPAGGT